MHCNIYLQNVQTLCHSQWYGIVFYVLLLLFFNDCFVCIVHSLWNFSSLIRDPAQAWQWKYRFLTTDCQGIVCNIKNTSIPASPGGSGGKESAYNTGDQGFNPRVGKIHRSSKWQPIPVCLPGEFHGTEKPGWLQSMRSQWARH